MVFSPDQWKTIPLIARTHLRTTTSSFVTFLFGYRKVTNGHDEEGSVRVSRFRTPCLDSFLPEVRDYFGTVREGP